MRKFLFLAFLLSALPALAGIPAGDEAKPGAYTSIPRSIWLLDEAGNATHVESQWQCPVAFGDYHRDDLHFYDNYGLDVSCEYRSGDAVVTLYLTRNPGGNLNNDFEGGKSAIVQRFAGATPLPDAEQKSFTSSRDWLHTIYAIDGPRSSGIWYGWFADWEFAIRATYAPVQRDAVFAMLSQMTDAARATSDHLARCAKSPAPQRGGVLITASDRLMQLSLIGGVPAPSGRCPIPSPATACRP